MTGRKPDFIILYAEKGSSPSSWFVVEMKATLDQVQRTVDQLKAGAEAIQNNPSFHVPESPQKLVPLVLHAGGIHYADFDRIHKKENRIPFRGKLWRIIVKTSPAESPIKLKDLV